MHPISAARTERDMEVAESVETRERNTGPHTKNTTPVSLLSAASRPVANHTAVRQRLMDIYAAPDHMPKAAAHV